MRDGSLTLLCDNDEAFGAVAVEFSPDGKHVAASDNSGMLRLWNARTTKLVKKWRAHEDAARSVVFTPNGRGLVTASRDHTLKYWDLDPPGFGDLREVSKFGHKVCRFYFFFWYLFSCKVQIFRNKFELLIFHRMVGWSSLVHTTALHGFGT